MRKNGLSAIFGCIMMPLTLLSCGGSVDGSGEIAVAPYTLQAASELSTYDLDVVADCSWTAEIQSADEVEAAHPFQAEGYRGCQADLEGFREQIQLGEKGCGELPGR